MVFNVKTLVRIAVVAGLAFVVMFFEVAMFTNFLKYDASEVPALVATFAMGPVAGVLVELLKNVLFFLVRGNLIGEAANFVAGGTMVLVAGVIYQLRKTRGMAVIAMLAGTVAMAAVMIPANIYVFLPAWGVPADQAMPMIVSAITPFNLVKGLLSSLITFLIYKRVGTLLKG